MRISDWSSDVCSSDLYQDAFSAVDDAERLSHLAAHCGSMKARVNALGSKNYWNEFADAPDYVIMFVPGEHFLSAALAHDPTLWDFAFQTRVRSEESRVGKECDSKCRSRGSPDH